MACTDNRCECLFACVCVPVLTFNARGVTFCLPGDWRSHIPCIHPWLACAALGRYAVVIIVITISLLLFELLLLLCCACLSHTLLHNVTHVSSGVLCKFLSLKHINCIASCLHSQAACLIPCKVEQQQTILSTSELFCLQGIFGYFPSLTTTFSLVFYVVIHAIFNMLVLFALFTCTSRRRRRWSRRWLCVCTRSKVKCQLQLA